MRRSNYLPHLVLLRPNGHPENHHSLARRPHDSPRPQDSPSPHGNRSNHKRHSTTMMCYDSPVRHKPDITRHQTWQDLSFYAHRNSVGLGKKGGIPQSPDRRKKFAFAVYCKPAQPIKTYPYTSRLVSNYIKHTVYAQ